MVTFYCTSLSHIISFYLKFSGKKWSRFNSEKICSLSYAKIQGRDNLIQKFRNSSVMNENPSYRPKIFFTQGVLVGLEEPFPMREESHRLLKSTNCSLPISSYGPVKLANNGAYMRSSLSPEQRIVSKPSKFNSC